MNPYEGEGTVPSKKKNVPTSTQIFNSWCKQVPWKQWSKTKFEELHKHGEVEGAKPRTRSSYLPLSLTREALRWFYSLEPSKDRNVYRKQWWKSTSSSNSPTTPWRTPNKGPTRPSLNLSWDGKKKRFQRWLTFHAKIIKWRRW